MDLADISFRTELKQSPLSEKAPLETGAIDKNESDHSDDWYVCRQCGNRITPLNYQVTIQGSSRHIFANPSGIIFEILCFSQAGGYTFSGSSSKDFAWFAGFSWRIVLCIRCINHLGWYFSSQHGGHFFGLITSRLSLKSITTS